MNRFAIDTVLIKKIKDLINDKKTAKLIYHKDTLDIAPKTREIEPHELIIDREVPILRAYQLQPEKGWRDFVLLKIASIEDAGGIFSARKGEQPRSLDFETSPKNNWQAEMKEYHKNLVALLEKPKPTKKEIENVVRFRVQKGIPYTFVLTVHAMIFKDCLVKKLENGIIGTPERNSLDNLHKILSKCGANLIGKNEWLELVPESESKNTLGILLTASIDH